MNQREIGYVSKSIHNRWLTFCILIFSGGVAYKLSYMKTIFYVPMQQFMGLSHTQIGGAMSVYGIVQTIGLIFGIYICDRFPKKYMISFSLIGIGLCGFYLATFPPYWGFLTTFAIMAFFGEVTYWPVLLKAVRLTGTEKDQGRIFGFLEMGRGVVDVIIGFSALAIFGAMGKEAAALRAAIFYLVGVTILAGVLCYIYIPYDEVNVATGESEQVSKSKAAFSGMMEAIKSIEIWAVAFNGFMIYCIYCGLTYFIPFLKDIYGLPVVMLGLYGIINQYGIKIACGLIGGFVSDKVTHSAAKYMRFAFVLSAVAMVGFILLPHERMGAAGNYMIGMPSTLVFVAIIYTMRAVFFAPMEEVKVPPQITGAAMALGCLVIYAPNAFAYLIYGSIIDKYPGMQGYRIVFSIMAACAVVGFFVSSFLIHCIKKKNMSLSSDKQSKNIS